MPLTSRAQTHPTASRMSDCGVPFFPKFRGKNQGARPRTPLKSSPPRRQTAARREKTSHPFFAYKLHASTSRKDKNDRQPLLRHSQDDDYPSMHMSRSVDVYTRVTPSEPVKEEGKEGRSYAMPRCILEQPELRLRTSDGSLRTATTASTAGSTSSSSCDNSWMIASPPVSPISNRVQQSQTNFAIVPYDEGVDDVDAFCDELLAQYEEKDEARGYLHLPSNEDLTIIKREEEYPKLEVENLNVADSFFKLVEDCEARWNSYADSIRQWSLSPVLSPFTSDDESQDSSEGASSNESSLSGNNKSHKIVEQRAEIEYLRAQLLRQQQILLEQEEAHSRLRPPPVEEIDTIPVEQIEVTMENNDEVSIYSGLSNLNDSVRANDDSTAMIVRRPLRRPDAASVSDNDSVLHSSRVHDFPLKLKAANGTIRNALYTGPRKGGACTGLGVLRFETGDIYMGEVRNGKMQGHGTYTFARRQKGRDKVLRGLFEDNVYMGWNPDALRRKKP